MAGLMGCNHDLWTPAVLPRSVLKAWWCAEDLTPGNCSSWPDRQTGWAPAAVGTPVASATSFVGTDASTHPGVTFDGTASCFSDTANFASIVPVGAEEGEIWAILDQQDYATDHDLSRTIVRYGGAVVSDGCRWDVLHVRIAPSITKWEMQNPTEGFTDQSVFPFVGVHISGAFWNINDQSARLDGHPTIPATEACSTLNTASTRFRIGASNGGAVSSVFQGVIAELLIPKKLSDDDHLRMEGYLAWKYGCRSLLPSTHPYKLFHP